MSIKILNLLMIREKRNLKSETDFKIKFKFSILFLLLFTAFALALLLVTPHTAFAQAQAQYAENEVIVGLQPELNYTAGAALVTACGCEYGYGASVIEYNQGLNCMLLRVDDVEGFISATRGVSGVRYAEPNYIVRALYTPDDPYYDYQWALPAINASTAWDYEQGNESVTIAIVDTGIQYDHPDIADNYAPGGYDWVNDDSNPYDDNGHGTHCAGIAAAVMDNGEGIAGVAQTSVMAEKVLDFKGVGYTWDIAQGIKHAADNGADVISMSLGTSQYSYTLEDACEYAWDEGCVLVGATGNDGISGVCYPAKFDSVIAVGAIEEGDTLAYFSNYGPEVELVAPGVDVFSTYPMSTYTYLSGTSMATPHVAGVAALLLSKYSVLNNNEVRARLNDTAVDLGDTGWDEYFGCGKINATAVLPFTLPPRPPVADFTYTPTNPKVNQTVTFNASKSSDSDGFIVSYDWSFGDMGYGSGIEVEHIYDEPGWYTVTLTVTDNESLTDSEEREIYLIPENVTVRYVDDDLIECPFANYTKIQDAIDAAEKGDTIIVCSGTYYENVHIDKTLTIIGSGAENTIIDSAGVSTVDTVGISGDVRGCVFKGFTIRNSWFGYSGIRVYSVNHCDISDNYIEITEDTSETSYGIYLTNSKYCNLSNNTIIATSRYDIGIKLKDSDSNVAYKNDVSSSDQSSSYGAYIEEGSNDNKFIENEFYDNYYGIKFESSEHNVIWKNDVYSNKGDGIWCDECVDTELADNDVYSNTRYGIYCDDCKDTLISENEVYSNNNRGVYLRNCDEGENKIINNVIHDDKQGIYLQNCDGNEIINNEILSNTQQGIYLSGCDDIKIIVNTVQSNTKEGIYLTSSTWNQIFNNNITRNCISSSTYTAGIYFSNSDNNRISTNTISDNKHLGICLYSGSDNNVISNNEIRNNSKSQNPTGKPDDGIYIYRSDSNEISDNVICGHTFDEGVGIRLKRANDISVTGNEINSSTKGIYVDTETNYKNTHITISNNWVTSIADHGIEVRGLESKHSEFVDVHFNNVSDCEDYGVKLEYVDHANVSENSVGGCSYGIALIYDCSDITVWHNSLFDNTDHAYDDEANTWDIGPEIGGNYWEGHECHGNPSNGSEPYLVDTFDSIDWYPFEDWNGWRALIVKNASTDKTLYNVSEPVRISCVVQNIDGFNISADEVTAVITKPDGLNKSCELVETYEGNYKCTYLNTSLGGNYNVTIRAQKCDYPSGTGNSSFKVKSDPPVAKFSYSPDFPLVDSLITFNASESFDVDGEIESYKWVFGDDTNGTGMVVTHSYSEAGTYNVTLTVTDNSGAGNSTSAQLQVVSFDTGTPDNPYPSISGIHNGTITPNVHIELSGLYTYACTGTGGHTESIRIWRDGEIDVNASWNGYAGDWHVIEFDEPEPVTLEGGKSYNYTLRTGSYPQIHHTDELEIGAGTITCTRFVDANGKIYNERIPAIRFF
ncbi:MAG: NosD domain-containing protein [Halobacteriota archaeon]